MTKTTANYPTRFRQQGVSFLDLILALALTGMIIQLGWQTAWQWHQQQKFSETAQILDTSLNALEYYLIRTAHLPCPDTSGDGYENRHVSGRCSKNYGQLPYLSLNGIGAADAFGFPIYYAVHRYATSDTSARNHRYACASASAFASQGSIQNTFYKNLSESVFCTLAQCNHTQPSDYDDQTPWCRTVTQTRAQPPYVNRLTPPLGTSSALLGSLRVCAQNPNPCRSNTPRSQHAGNQVIALMVSFGANAGETWQDCNNASPREQQNCTPNGYYQLDTLSHDFDDQLRWLTIHQLKDKLYDQIDWHQTTPAS